MYQLTRILTARMNGSDILIKTQRKQKVFFYKKKHSYLSMQQTMIHFPVMRCKTKFFNTILDLFSAECIEKCIQKYRNNI